ncbi:frataxin homolog, mitochondrial [Cephus cinctus]|uniref:ferroxidase n=1 Tax=Cephus cinctus TaxID=211228 RepID=A0AAJ7FFK1_CEPCN|nr:frataxin homolog, mitochondrial [Cephus cinctus]
MFDKAIAFNGTNCLIDIHLNEKIYNALNNYKNWLEQNNLLQFKDKYQSVYSPQIDLSTGQFEQISNETLESLTEYFDELIEQAGHLKDADVSYGDGVITVKFGEGYGTYVINRQTPNKQIWLSSPKSGPKRYDFIDGKWIYKHDGQTLHELLNREIPAIIRNQAIFDKCSYSGREQHVSLDRS